MNIIMNIIRKVMNGKREEKIRKRKNGSKSVN